MTEEELDNFFATLQKCVEESLYPMIEKYIEGLEYDVISQCMFASYVLHKKILARKEVAHKEEATRLRQLMNEQSNNI